MGVQGVCTKANENSVRHKLNLSTEAYSPLQIKELSLIFCFDVTLEQKMVQKVKASSLPLHYNHYTSTIQPVLVCFPIQLSLNMAKIYNILVT